MGLLSFFQRSQSASPQPAADAAQAPADVRSRSRQRLIGATVLLALAVVAFPLLLETQPRPVALDIPIEIPRKDTNVALGTPIAQPAMARPAVIAPQEPTPVAPSAAASPALPSASAIASTPPPSSAKPVITETAAQQGREVPASAAAAQRPAAPAALGDKPVDDGGRAKAMLDGQPDPAASAALPRFVVQVGAFTDPAQLRETRQKVEKLGLKTYTQVVEVDGQKRTRVRVGPLASREEAEGVAARLKASGMAPAVLVI